MQMSQNKLTRHSCNIKDKMKFLSLPYFSSQAVFKEKQVNQQRG